DARAAAGAGRARGPADAAPGRQRDGDPGRRRQALAERAGPGAQGLMVTRAAELVRELQLAAHPEGGYYRRLFASAQQDAEGRAACSSILFLLPGGAASRWHRVDADELWFFHEGAPLELLIGTSPSELRSERLGPLAADQDR